MTTVQTRLNNWALEELRGATQVNNNVLLAWYNKGLLIFQKMILEYLSWQHNVSSTVKNIQKDVSEYSFPMSSSGLPDFYSIIQLRVAYKTDKNWMPLYRVCKPINLSDYNIRPTNNVYDTNNKLVEQWWQQVWAPIIWWKISELEPRYMFVSRSHIKIYPTPTEDVENWLSLSYNYIPNAVTLSTYEEDLNLPRYFFDAIEDYMTFRLYQAENPEMAQRYYQQFENTLHDNIYGLNKDKRPIEEGFANTSYFSHY